MEREISRAEVQSELRRYGFEPDHRSRTHAEGWELPGGEHVKLKKGNRRPLVLHPRHQAHVRRLLEIPGVISSEGLLSHNSNFVGFPKRVHTGIQPISYGLEFGFKSSIALRDFLDALLGSDSVITTSDDDVARAQDLPTNETERRAVIAARRGQGRFRRDLELHWGGCAVTGLANRALLRASHIQPWRDSNNRERLDPFNGLLLAVHLDAAFDRGLIAFSDDGRMMVNSDRLSQVDADILSLVSETRLRSIDPAHQPYLRVHRTLHGFQEERN